MSITHEVFVEPSAFAVALPDEHVVLCHEVFGQASMRVHRIEDVQVACDRVARNLPQVVVVSKALAPELREMIEDRAVAIGAVLVLLEVETSYESIERSLRGGLLVARERFGRR